MSASGDQHVQSAESLAHTPVPVPQDDAVALPSPGPALFPAGLIFGAFSGSLLGAVTAAACSCFAGLREWFFEFALTGAVLGPIGGALVGAWERKRRGNLVRPDCAAIIGALYGLVPTLVVVATSFAVVRGMLSLGLLVGMAFVGPTIGLLVGGILDRAYEASRRQTWGAALGFGLTGAAACAGLVGLFAGIDTAPDARAVAAEARILILKEWRKDHDFDDARVGKIDLTHEGGKVYKGTFVAKIRAEVQRFDITVTLTNDTISAEWQPVR